MKGRLSILMLIHIALAWSVPALAVHDAVAAADGSGKWSGTIQWSDTSQGEKRQPLFVILNKMERNLRVPPVPTSRNSFV